MRIRLEATPEELRDKGSLFIEQLAKALAPVAPDLADALTRTLPELDPKPLRNPALQELRERVSGEYSAMLDSMVKDIELVLTAPPQILDVQKAEPEVPESLQKAEPAPTILTPALIEELLAKGAESARELHGKLNRDHANMDLSLKLDAVQKSLGQLDDRTIDLMVRDRVMPRPEPAIGERRVRELLLRRGYRDVDFEQGGKFYGFSANELLGIAIRHEPVQKSEAPAPVVVVNETMPEVRAIIPEELTKAVQMIADKLTAPVVTTPAAPPAPTEVVFARDEHGRITGASVKPRE